MAKSGSVQDAPGPGTPLTVPAAPPWEGPPSTAGPARSALAASAVAWLFPATTARRTANLPLLRAFVSHIVAAFLTCLSLLFLVAVVEREDLFSILGEIIEEFVHDPYEATLVTLVIAIFIEMGFLGLALIAMPWGARDERLPTSFANALRQTWLHAMHAVPAVFVVGLTIIMIEEASRSGPERFIFRHGEVLVALEVLLVSTWILWSLLRAVGTPRPVPAVARPPTCETCGYNLTGALLEGRCPECGTAVVDSLGPHVRRPTPWEQRREIGRCRAYSRCVIEAVFHPTAFGRRLAADSPGTDHRLLLAAHLALAFVIGTLGTGRALEALPETRHGPGTEHIWFGIAPCVSCAEVMLVLAGTSVCVLIAAGHHHSQVRRNLVGAAMKVASYQSVFLLPWACLTSALAVVVVVLAMNGFFRRLEARTGINEASLGFLFFVAPNLLCAAGYLALIWKGTSGLRFANR